MCSPHVVLDTGVVPIYRVHPEPWGGWLLTSCFAYGVGFAFGPVYWSGTSYSMNIMSGWLSTCLVHGGGGGHLVLGTRRKMASPPVFAYGGAHYMDLLMCILKLEGGCTAYMRTPWDIT